MMLCDDKFFNGDTFAEQLENAYDDFKAFLRATKISCSQKMFTPGLAFRLNTIYFFQSCKCKLHMVVCVGVSTIENTPEGEDEMKYHNDSWLHAGFLVLPSSHSQTNGIKLVTDVHDNYGGTSG